MLALSSSQSALTTLRSRCSTSSWSSRRRRTTQRLELITQKTSRKSWTPSGTLFTKNLTALPDQVQRLCCPTCPLETWRRSTLLIGTSFAQGVFKRMTCRGLPKPLGPCFRPQFKAYNPMFSAFAASSKKSSWETRDTICLRGATRLRRPLWC